MVQPVRGGDRHRERDRDRERDPRGHLSRGQGGRRPPGKFLALVPPQACATPAGDFDSSDEEGAEGDPRPLPISW